MKKLLSGLLALVLVLSLLPLSAFAADTGKCGDNLTYTIANGVLTVSGTGAMTEYGTTNWPWYAQRDSITEVVIGEDVTYIGKYAFHGYDNLTKLTVRGSARIGEYAFAHCQNLTTVWLAGTASTISFGAFNFCKNLDSFTLRAAVEQSNSAFATGSRDEGLDPEEVHLLDAGGKDVTQDYLVTVEKSTSNMNYLTVANATPTYTAPTARTGLSYTGTMQQLVNPGSADGGQMQYALGTAAQATGTYSTQIPEAKDADTYYVWYKVVATDAKLKDIAPACVPVTIDRCELSAMNVTLSDTTFTYNANEQSPTVVVSYNGNPLTKDTDYTIDWAGDRKSAGTQTLRVLFLGNYTGTVEESYQIKRRAISINWGPKEFMPYTGQQIIPQVTAEGLIGSDTCELTTTVVETTPGAGIIPGRWHATITALSNENYCLPENENLVTVEYGITNGFQEQPVVSSVNETIAGKADGKITGLTTTMEYSTEYTADDHKYTKVTDGNMTFAPGTYYVRYQAKQYYNPSAFTTVTIAEGRKLTVSLPQNQVGYKLTADKSQLAYKESVTLTLDIGPGYSKTPGFAVKCNGQDVHWGDATTLSMQNCTEDLVITVEGIADVTAPTVKLSVADKEWTAFSTSIAFDLYYNTPQDVTITAADSGSGIRSIRYHLGFGQMGLDEVQAITDWTDYNGTFKIAPDNDYVIYVQVVDNAGNGTCVNSDGIVLDNIAPTLEGIEDGKTYYGDLTVIKSAEQFHDIKQVTLDGQGMGFLEGTYGRIPADNGQHTVVAEDHAGNKTTYTVTVMKQYTVTFMADGKVYDTQKVGHGMAAAIPQPPEKKGYTVAWDKEPDIITGNVTVTAVYTPLTDTPKTGDAIGWAALMMLLSAAALVILIIEKKKAVK